MIDCSFIVDTGFSGAALCSSNWSHRYIDYRRSISPQIPKIYKCGGRLKFVFGNQESIASERAIILPIWVGGQFRPVRGRLIGGDADLLLRIHIVNNCALMLISGSVTSTLRMSHGKR